MTALGVFLICVGLFVTCVFFLGGVLAYCCCVVAGEADRRAEAAERGES